MKILLALCVLLASLPAQADTLRIGSKRFTESYILGEVLKRTVEQETAVEHRPGMGNTGILYSALKSGSIDLYPEYTGTIAKEILKIEGNPGLAELNRSLAPLGLGVAVRLGFNDSYALAMREDRASALGIRTLSDLAKRPGLKLGLSQEFIGRGDGWPGLKAAYRMPYATPSGLDHGLAYEAIAAGRIDVMDVYTTDAKIERFGLRVLEDDRTFFPRYDAVLFYRLDVPKRFPSAWRTLETLEGKIDERRMIRMNAAAELEGKTFAQAAALLDPGAGARVATQRKFLDVLFGPDFWRLTGEHLLLVFASLAASARGEGAEDGGRHIRDRRRGPDDSLARAACVPHSTLGRYRHRPCARRAVPLRAPAHRPQYLHRTGRHSPRHAAGRDGAGPVDA